MSASIVAGASAKHLLLGAAVAVLLGCQQSPPPDSVSAPTQSWTTQLKDEGDALAARGEYAAAAAKYQKAVKREPGDVSLHFALGVALSRLNRREETVEQFRWVVTRGAPDSPETQAARLWLDDAGELPRAGISATSSTLEASAANPPSTGRLKGKTEPSGEASRHVNLALVEEHDPNVEPLAFSKRLELGEAYEFQGLHPGKYRLTVEDLKTSAPLWDLEVTVTADTDTVLNLTSANRKSP